MKTKLVLRLKPQPNIGEEEGGVFWEEERRVTFVFSYGYGVQNGHFGWILLSHRVICLVSLCHVIVMSH